MAKASAEKCPAVVVIDDDEEVAEMVRIVVEESGAKVHWATDGKSGLELVRQVRPAVVLLDIMMPKMNGYEVCAAIQSDPELAATPIIILTGLVEKDGEKSEDEWRASMQVADFITKPFQVGDLSSRIKKILYPAGE